MTREEYNPGTEQTHEIGQTLDPLPMSLVALNAGRGNREMGSNKREHGTRRTEWLTCLVGIHIFG